MIDSFQKRKKDILSKSDKSSIGEWDKKIKKLCDKINSLENYYTTSSCSGRIILMIDAEKKGKDLFVFVSHEKINFEKLKKELDKIINSTTSLQPSPRPPAPGKDVFDNKQNLLKNKNMKFKFEPCIIHVACKTLEDAEKFLEKGKLAGWKKSGIIGLRNGITVELNSTEKLEFPIIQNKKILVDDDFLKIVVDEASKKLEKSWRKIEKLQKIIE